MGERKKEEMETQPNETPETPETTPNESPTTEETPQPAEAEILTKVLEKLNLLAGSGGEKDEEKKPPTPPPPPQLPERPSRITQAAYEELAQYAAKQAQEAYRYKLAAEYGLDPKDLEGEFESPQHMRQFAEMLALKYRLADLEKKLEAAQAPKPPEESASSPPPGDTGGPTGRKDMREYLKQRYQEIQQMGRGDEALRRYLTTVYQDPERIIR